MKILPRYAKVSFCPGLGKTAGRALDAPRVEPFRGVQYWLYNPRRQIRVLVDLSALIPARHSFAQLHLNVTNGDGPPSSGAFWRWQRAFPQHTQPFVLTAEAEPDWFSVSLLPYLLLFLTWGSDCGRGKRALAAQTAAAGRAARPLLSACRA